MNQNPTIKLLKKGIKIDGKYFACRYFSAKNNINGNATIYIRGCEPLPDTIYSIFRVDNDTDIQTDYFEKDKIRVSPDNPYFAQVEALAR